MQKQVERRIAGYEDSGDPGPKSSIGKLTEQRGDEEAAPRTIFQAVLESSLPAQEKIDARIAGKAFVTVVAEGETTAKLLTSALYHLLANLVWKNQVVMELDEMMPDHSAIPHSTTLEQSPVLRAAIGETLRISAPVTNRV